MFQKLKRFLRGEPPPVAQAIDDPILGTLTWSKEDDAWLTSPEHAGDDFVIQIAGTPRPDSSLVRHAADIFRTREAFLTSVHSFLKAEGHRMSRASDEIAGLKIERVCLFWPHRPDDGMIYFDGGQEDRVWRCDYIARKPRDLGFDS